MTKISVLSTVALAALCCVMSAPAAYSDSLVGPQEFRTMAVFELVVSGSKVLRSGPSKIVTESAFVTLTHTLMENADGLEIQFFTKPITEAGRADILENGARELRKSDFAALVLFLDTNHQVRQVNLSYVVPGTTVARTVAWKPEDLRQFSNYKFDGKRLLLKSKGLYNESGDEQLKLSWEVDLNLPVFERIKK
jgi:hypothetical protein